ncbi:MAG: type IV toxin-antitoxin system AbiEi family antitoxin [Verrucomicrobiota bacterium]
MKTKLPNQSRRQTGAAAAFVESQLAVGRVGFSLEGLVAETGLSRIAARFQLLRLGPKVVRVSPRQSFFLIVGPEHRSLGAPPVMGWLHDYFEWLGRPYYLALQSAASLYGSNPQAVQVTQVMTDRPMRPIQAGRMQLRFFVKRNIQRAPTLQPEGSVAPIWVSTPEATAYDLVRHAGGIGGMDRTAETLRPFASRLRRRELRRVLDAEAEVPVAQRLGFVLEAIGELDLAMVVHAWLPPRLLPVKLLPSGGNDAKDLPLASRWQVLNNSAELKV